MEKGMRAIVIRHGKVDFQWRKWSTSKQFNEDCKRYDEAPVCPLISDGYPAEEQDIYISSLGRSKETARQLFGAKEFICTELIDEVPLCAGIISKKGCRFYSGMFQGVSNGLLTVLHKRKAGQKPFVARKNL